MSSNDRISQSSTSKDKDLESQGQTYVSALPAVTSVKAVDADVGGPEGEPSHDIEDYAYDPEVERSVVRKLDGRLMPLIFCLYVFNAIDRSNLGALSVDLSSFSPLILRWLRYCCDGRIAEKSV